MTHRGRGRLVSIAVASLTIAGTGPLAGSDRITVALKSGSPQSAHAYVAAHATRYEAAFPDDLAVRVSGRRDAKIRFVCETAGCEFPPSDQPDAVHRVDVRSFAVDASGGIAAIKLTVSMPSPQTVVVSARPADGRAAHAVRFALRME